jgi:multidrug efflux pump subunit AcrB
VSELEAKSEAKSGWISIVRLFVRHHTAANLLMALMIILGLYSLVRLNTQFFPDFGVDVVFWTK